MNASAILCVDDEEIVINSLRASLMKSYGQSLEYEFCQSADEALEVLESFAAQGIRLAAVVSDWLMPEVKGDALLLKVQRLFPQARLVILTGQADPQALDGLLRALPQTRVLHKPWEERDLVEAIGITPK